MGEFISCNERCWGFEVGEIVAGSGRGEVSSLGGCSELEGVLRGPGSLEPVICVSLLFTPEDCILLMGGIATGVKPPFLRSGE
jgi:hypothetical protein